MNTTTGWDWDEADDADLADFDSEDLTTYDRPADGGYLKSMWRSRGFRHADTHEENLVIAHGMVQSFVNAFATDGHYAVRFDPACTTAGTDLKTRNVVITPAPVMDSSLTPEQAGEILTGLAVHEIAHGRYGRPNLEAVEAIFKQNRPAARLSNLLSDVHDEGRFTGNFPGYAGIFQPVLDYVGALGGVQEASLEEPINLAIGAIRYPEWNTWTPETEAERDWWQDWAARWSHEDAPKRHVAAIREALKHIVDADAERAAQPEPEPQQGEGDGDDAAGNESGGDESGESGEADGQSGAGEPGANEARGMAGAESEGKPSDKMTDAALNKATRDVDAGEAKRTSSCAGSDTVEDAAIGSGTVGEYSLENLQRDADAIIEAEGDREQADFGATVDVAKSLRGLTTGAMVQRSDMAARYIRNALLQSRTGTDEVESHHKQGRLDGRGLVRIGHGDSRVFEQRRAESTGRYLIWVMLDCSGSMRSTIHEEAAVGHSLAVASTAVQSMRMAVWGWSDMIRPARNTDATVVKAWETGEDPSQILTLPGVPLGNTPDATSLDWARRAILKEARGDEQPVIIMVSDGEGEARMEESVERARRAGVIVRGVSFGGGMSAEALQSRYGRGNYVAWAGSIVATARPLAAMIAKLVNLGQ